MEVRLLVANGKKAGQVVPVSGPKFFIGRAEDCHLRPRSDTVSRHHCALLLESGLVLVRDLGSKNGTFVNDERVRPEAEVKNGDRLRVGQLEFEVQMLTDVGGKKKPAVQSVQEAAVRTATASGPRGEDDLKLDDWLSDDANVSDEPVAETSTIENTWTEGGTDAEEETREETEEKETAETDAAAEESAAATTEQKPIPKETKGPPAPGAWNKKAATSATSAANTRDAAGDILKNFLRGR